MKEPDRKVLDQFLSDLDRMTVHRSESLGPSLKKPLLVLLVLARLHDGRLKENRIRLADLEAELAELIARFGGRAKSPSPAMPFYHLRTAPFWELHLSEQPSGNSKMPSRKILHAPQTYASLKPGIFIVLKSSKEARSAAAAGVVGKWWPAEHQSALRARLGL